MVGREEIGLKINAGPSKFMVMMSLVLFEQLTTTTDDKEPP